MILRKIYRKLIHKIAVDIYPYIEERNRIQNSVSFGGYKSVGKNVHCESFIEHCGAEYIELGDNVYFSHSTILTAWDKYESQSYSPIIKIGNNCHFGAYNHITAINRIEIGEYCLTGKWVTITDNAHGMTDNSSLNLPPIKRELVSKGPVIIGKNVWIGDKVTILPGVSIGDGAVIGANAVVAKDIPAHCVAIGNPAIIIKKSE